MKKFDNLENEFEDLKKSLLSSSDSDVQEKIKALENEISTLSSSIENVEQTSSENATNISSLSTSISELSSEIDSLDSNIVHIAGTETITGQKTFLNNVMVGTATKLQTDTNGEISLGRTDGTTSTPHINFVTDGSSSTEFNSQILASDSQIEFAAPGGLSINSETLVDSSNKIPIERLNVDTAISSSVGDSYVPTSKAVYDFVSSQSSSSSSSSIYMHNIVLKNGTTLSEVAFRIFSKSADAMDSTAIAEYLYSKGHVKYYYGIPLTGGAYTGTSGTVYPYAMIYSSDGAKYYGRYYTGTSTGSTTLSTTAWTVYDTVTEIT